MKKLILTLISLFFVSQYYSQTIYFKTIKDLQNSPVFGEVASIQQDSLNLYLVINSGYNPSGICGPGNGSTYIVKVNKTTGTIISTDSMNAAPDVMKVNDCFKLNNCLYLGGEMSSLFEKHSFG